MRRWLGLGDGGENCYIMIVKVHVNKEDMPARR